MLNHIGTVHAIAMCNRAELAAGTATEATISDFHRWIAKGMSVEYLHKATTGLYATAIVAAPAKWDAAAELPVPVTVTDAAGSIVFRATGRMWITVENR